MSATDFDIPRSSPPPTPWKQENQRISALLKQGGYVSFSHCMDVDERRTNQQTRKQTSLYREKSSGHWFNSIPEGDKQSHKINFQSQHLCFCNKRLTTPRCFFDKLLWKAVFTGSRSQPCPSLHRSSAPWAVSSSTSSFFKIWLLEEDQIDSGSVISSKCTDYNICQPH